jgi:hypothetical protein
VGYYLIRGHTWADTTPIEEAIQLVDDVAGHLPDLAPTLRAYLIRRGRLHGPGYSVADVERVGWYRRKVAAWEQTIPAPWPTPAREGQRARNAWEDLRLAHLASQGWSPEEIAGVLGFRVRGIRERLHALGSRPL